MTADVIVAGAGIIGSTIAWRLAQRGASVILLDSGRLGGEATSAAAGMLAPGGEMCERSVWFDLALESLRLYPAFVAELAEAARCPIDFRQKGAVEVALDEEELARLDRRAAAQETLGIRSERIDPSEAGLTVAGIEGARYYPGDALVDPREIVRALRAVCAPIVREGLRVLSIDASRRTARVETSSGTFECARAVLAAGAWSSSIVLRIDGARWTGPEAYPVRGHLFSCRLQPGTLGPIVRHGHTYLVQRTGGLALAGATSEDAGFDRQVDMETIESLRGAAARLVPAFGSAGIVESWNGFRPATRDGLPAIGRVLDSVLWLAYGHYRNGILMAPATAARVSAAILQESVEKV